MAHDHDRFLYEKDGSLHFGCVNPFCGHGDPALPKHYAIPLDSKDVTMKFLNHGFGRIQIEVTPKDPEYTSTILDCKDNLEECSKSFKQLKFRRITGG